MDTQIKGISIGIEPSLFLLFAIFYIADMLPLYLLALLAAVLHELGHLAALRLLKGEINGIRIHPFGISILTGRNLNLSYYKEIIVFLSGPAVSASLAVIFYCLWQNYFWQNGLFCFFGINLILFILNMLPVRGLDGGRALESFLLLFFEHELIWKLIQVISLISVFILFVLGIGLLYTTGYNVSLLIVAIFLFIGLIKG